METVLTGDSPSTQSPLTTDPADKMNGEDDLDFTITMNESEDDGSSDGSCSEPATKGKVKLNGKTATDEGSESSTPEEKKGGIAEGRDGDEEGDQEGLENGGGDAGHQESGSDGHADDSSQQPDCETGGKVDAEETEEKQEDEQSGETGDGDEKETEKSEDEGQEKENHIDEKQTDKEAEPDVILSDHDDSGSASGLGDGKSNESGKKYAESSEKNTVELSDDDDVMEIEGSPMKFPVRPPGSTSSAIRDRLDVSKAVASAVSSASLALSGAANLLPYLTSLPGASLVPSAGGVQLVLPPGTAGVQGLGAMFFPNSTLLGSVASTASMFQPSSGNTVPRNSSSLLYPQYLNPPGQSNRQLMPQSQGAAPVAQPALTSIPEKPTSSMGMMEMIRWEVENHINIKPKYVKPQPKAELGNLAKWVHDLGSDLAKEYVYHDLVRIQRRRKDEGNLTDKEKGDFAKLQEIDRELNQKVGRLKFRLTKSCRCGFRTELDNVLFHHHQHAHNERGGFYRCIMCKFSTRQGNAFRFHMESEHSRAGYLENRPSFYECTLCPYETNYTNRLDQHKVRCLRQYRESVNLHPSCLTGPEVNLCLENVFYFVFTRQFMNTIMPKAQTPVRSSATKIRDMPSSSDALQTRKLQTNTTLASASKQILPRNAVQYQQRGVGKQQAQPRAALSGTYQALTSKMNAVHNQNFAAASTSVRGPTPNQVPGPNQPNNGFEVCEICGGYVKDRKALRIHFFYAHRIDMPFGVFERPQPPLYCATCFARFWTAQGLQKHIEVHKNDLLNATQKSNGVAGKCISCGHRVPNILMHMRMVHNREMRHYLAALMCIFCGARFTAKPEVEDHMGRVHGVLVKNMNVQGSMGQPQLANPRNANQQSRSRGPTSRQSPSAAAPKPGSSGKSGRMCQCVLCNLSFHRNVDLTRHCMRVHHTCMKCGLVVVDKESLARHTCLHSASGMRTCQICKEPGFHPAYYIKHMRDKHLRKCSVVLRHIDRAVVETMKRPITISDSDDDEPVHKPPAPKVQKTGARDSISKSLSDVKTRPDTKSDTQAKEGDSKATVEESGADERDKELDSAGNGDTTADKARECERTEGDPEEGVDHEGKDNSEVDDDVVKTNEDSDGMGNSAEGVGQEEGGVSCNYSEDQQTEATLPVEDGDHEDEDAEKPDLSANEKSDIEDSTTGQCSVESDNEMCSKKRELENTDNDDESQECKRQKLDNDSSKEGEALELD